MAESAPAPAAASSSSSSSSASNARVGSRPGFGRPLAAFVEGAVDTVQQSYRWVAKKIEESEVFAYEDEPRGPRTGETSGAELQASDLFSPRGFERLVSSTSPARADADARDPDEPEALRIIRMHKQNKLKLTEKHSMPPATSRARAPIGGAKQRTNGMSSAPNRLGSSRLAKLASIITPRMAPSRAARGRAAASAADSDQRLYEA